MKMYFTGACVTFIFLFAWALPARENFLKDTFGNRPWVCLSNSYKESIPKHAFLFFLLIGKHISYKHNMQVPAISYIHSTSIFHCEQSLSGWICHIIIHSFFLCNLTNKRLKQELLPSAHVQLAVNHLSMWSLCQTLVYSSYSPINYSLCLCCLTDDPLSFTGCVLLPHPASTRTRPPLPGEEVPISERSTLCLLELGEFVEPDRLALFLS